MNDLIHPIRNCIYGDADVCLYEALDTVQNKVINQTEGDFE